MTAVYGGSGVFAIVTPSDSRDTTVRPVRLTDGYREPFRKDLGKQMTSRHPEMPLSARNGMSVATADLQRRPAGRHV